MAGERRRRIALGASAVAAVAVSCLTYWLIDSKRLNGEAVTAAGGVAAALATAVAAVAAWQAARTSEDVTHRAVEALGRVLTPTVQVGLLEGWHELDDVDVPTAVVWAYGHPAIDVVLRVRVSGGAWQERPIPRLQPVTDPSVEATRIPLEGVMQGEGVSEVVATYRDEQRLLRWEVRWMRHADGTIENPPPRLLDS